MPGGMATKYTTAIALQFARSCERGTLWRNRKENMRVIKVYSDFVQPSKSVIFLNDRIFSKRPKLKLKWSSTRNFWMVQDLGIYIEREKEIYMNNGWIPLNSILNPSKYLGYLGQSVPLSATRTGRPWSCQNSCLQAKRRTAQPVGIVGCLGHPIQPKALIPNCLEFL